MPELTIARSDSSDDLLAWFLTGFSARNLAEPLLSVVEGASVAAANAIFQGAGIDVIGVRSAGFVVGWISRDQPWPDDAKVPPVNSFDPSVLVADSAPLNEVICSLRAQPRLFVRAFGQISGVISHSTLDKPPLRMWLFGLITISEQRVTQLIDQLFPNDSWQEQLSAGRRAMARELQTLREQRGQRRALLDCLQFADKGQLVARNECLRNQTRFASRSDVERFVQGLQDLRNNLAHAQDISADWEIIYELAANVQRIVCGAGERSATVTNVAAVPSSPKSPPA
jgi:hypothetical protein